jgi:hypothetical protein
LSALECGGKRRRDTAFKPLYPKTPLKLLTPLNNQKAHAASLRSLSPHSKKA